MAYLEPETLEEKIVRYRCGSLLVWGNAGKSMVRHAVELPNDTLPKH